MIYKPQSKFPLLDRYKEIFDVTPYTIFAYDKVIYCDYELPEHLQVHERRHLIRQQKMGVDEWVERYLTDTKFRLNEEVIAYREQLESVKNRSARHRLRIQCANDLASSLYGNIVTLQEAMDLLH